MWNKLKSVLMLILLFIVTQVAFAIGEESDAFTGRLALVGMDYNIYTYDFTSENLTPLTNDAEDIRRYQWPTWSNDGRVAYFCCDLRATRRLESYAYISSDGTMPGELIYEGENETVIYAGWSPSDCANGTDCRELAMLINNVDVGNLTVEMVQNTNSETNNRTIETGSPFYYQWNPDGTQMIFHRNNTRLDIYDIAESDATQLDTQSSGAFQSAQWSPVDNRILYGIPSEEGNTTDIVIADGGDVTPLIEGISGFVSFLWSPDGRYIAYRTLSSDSISSVIVVDSQTGETITDSLVDGVISFFWSPDSSKIAYVTPSTRGNDANANRTEFAKPMAAQNNNAQFAWSVLDVESGQNTQYFDFIGTYEFNYLMAYFDQFAPTHRLWSPDSRYLVYNSLVDVETNPRAVVNVIDTSNPNKFPITVSDGVFAVWSFE